MKIKKYQNPGGNLPRRRLINFTPEQEKQFNQVTVPGTNTNSNVTVGENARRTGVQTQNFQAQEAARKDAEIESRSERKTTKRQTTVGERLRGDNGYSSYMSGGTGMSGRDPLLGTIFDWTVGPKGVEALGKTLLWNFAKHVPTSELGKWGRNYFINNAFKQELRNPIQFGLGKDVAESAYVSSAPKPSDTGLTSLKFFERPSKISEAESLGFGRSRGFNSQSGEDLHQFYTLQNRRQTLQDAARKLTAPKDMGVDETIAKNSGATIEDGYLMSNGYRYTPVSEKHFSTGYNMSFGRQGVGGNGHNYGLNLGGQATRVKDLGRESEIAYSRPGVNLDRNDPLNLDVVVTTSNNAENKEGIQLLTKGMKDMESGAEFSGDASSTTTAEALSTWLRIAKNKPALREEAMANARRVLKNNEGIDLGTHSIYDPIHGVTTENATMSPDAYSYLLRTANSNPDKFHLGYQMNAGNFNSFARNPRNAYMYDVEQNYLNGLITPEEYIEKFNSWIGPLGGRKAYIYNGKLYKPQPFLIRNKQGGKLKINNTDI